MGRLVADIGGMIRPNRLENNILWPIINCDGPDSTYSVNEATFEPDNATSVISYRVPSEDIDIVNTTFLGYAVRQGLNLHRILPQPHPRWLGLWARRTRIIGEARWDEVDTKRELPFNDGTGVPGGEIDDYDFYRVDVFYTHRPYNIATDGETQDEKQRWIEKLPAKSYVDNVALEGGTLVFITRDGVDLPVGSPGRLPIAVPTAFRVPKADIVWIWHQVPIPWVLNNNNIAINILQVQGKVNNAMFAGYSTGTLLFDSADIIYEYATEPPTSIGLNRFEPPRYLKIKLNFKFSINGWNKYPYPGLGTWDLVAYRNFLTRSVYEEANFDTIFNPVAL